jgi:hypothetical protein
MAVQWYNSVEYGQRSLAATVWWRTILYLFFLRGFVVHYYIAECLRWTKDKIYKENVIAHHFLSVLFELLRSSLKPLGLRHLGERLLWVLGTRIIYIVLLWWSRQQILVNLYAYCIIVIVAKVGRVLNGNIACIDDMNTVQTPMVIITTSGVCYLILYSFILIL